MAVALWGCLASFFLLRGYSGDCGSGLLGGQVKVLTPKSNDVSSTRIEDRDHKMSPKSIHQIQILKLITTIFVIILLSPAYPR